jgi:hypothetical protein
MAKKSFGLGVLKDVSDLRGSQVPIDGRDVPTGLLTREYDHVELTAVGSANGNIVTALQAPRAKAVHHLIAFRVQFAARVFPPRGVHQGKHIWLARRVTPKPMICHVSSSFF